MFRKNKKSISNVNTKMNEDMETKIIYSTYRRTVCSIMESKDKNYPMLNILNCFKDFDTPHVLEAYTEEQLDMIMQMKKELKHLGELFGYF